MAKSIILLIRVVEWSQQPLKKLVEDRIKPFIDSSVYRSAEYLCLDKEDRPRFVKKQVLSFIVKNNLEILLERNIKEKYRSVSNWDMLNRERAYLEDMRVEWEDTKELAARNFPFKPKTKVLGNIKLMYHLDIDCAVLRYRSKEQQASIKDWLVEPVYYLTRKRKLQGKTEPTVYLQFFNKEHRYLGTLEPYFVEEEDTRSQIRVRNQDGPGHHITRAKEYQRNNSEGVYTFDREIIMSSDSFTEWARQLILAVPEYQNDLGQAIKDLKSFYYKDDRVYNYLVKYYEEHKEATVSFQEFLKIVEEYDNPPLENYPLCEVLDEYLEQQDIVF